MGKSKSFNLLSNVQAAIPDQDEQRATADFISGKEEAASTDEASKATPAKHKKAKTITKAKAENPARASAAPSPAEGEALTNIKGDQSMKFYTLNQVAEILHKTQRTLYNYLNAGTLKAKKIGKSWLVSEESLKEFLTTGTR